MIRFFTTCFLGCLILSNLIAQTFSGNGGAIPDDGNSVDFEIPVGGLPNAVNTSDFGLESVCFTITHTWTADLAVWLVAPDGTVLPLCSGLGGDTDGFVNTCLSSNATTSIFQVWYPFTGTFKPFGDMGLINQKGLNPNGNWRLHILDTYAFADAGELVDWKITFGDTPCQPFPFVSSDLPILKINTDGQIIPDEPKVTAQLQVIDNGPGQRNFVQQNNFAYEGPIGIELRGRSSQGFPKKSYAIEVRDELGEDKEVSLLGLPETSDYALAANFSDKTLMRNALAYETFRQLGRYATRTRFCEMILDGTYQGIYILTERIKRGAERVDIARLSPADTSGADLTGGYILRIDWNTSPGWNSQFSQPNSPNIYTYFQHEYPVIDRMHPTQIEYIRSYVDSFEVALAGPDYQNGQNGWRRFADEGSFIDYLIVNEISKNVDGYRLSTYFHKDRDDNGGKLTMGPPWDYDLAFYNADYCEAFLASGWAYDINYVCQDAGMPFWWERLVSDTTFAQNLACRWQSLRTQGNTLNTAHLNGVIDSMAAVLQEASARNFQFWPILGIYVWPNPGPLPNTYQGEVEKLKSWLNERLEWLDFALGQHVPTLNAGFSAVALNSLKWQFNAVSPGLVYLWEFGDGNTSSEAAPQHTYAGPGTYTVRLTVSTPFGCSNDSEQTIQILSSGAANLTNGSISITPNPAKDFVELTLPAQRSGELQIRLINALGQVQRTAQIDQLASTYRLGLADLPAGIYLLALEGAGKRESIRLVIRQD